MGILDALGDKVKKVVSAYKTGDQESSSLGNELREKAKNIDEYRKATEGPSSAPVKPAAKSATPSKKTPYVPRPGQYGTRPGEKIIDTTYPDSPMPKMHKGGMVKKTGPHMLLKGEAVLSKKDTKKMSALGGQPSAPSVGSPDGMSIDKLDDGSFHITHRNNPPKDGGPTPEPKKFSARNTKHLVRHVRQAFGGGAQDDGMAEPSSYADGGVVQKSGMAKVHAGETVVPAPVRNPDIYIGGKPKPAPKAPKKYQATPDDVKRIVTSSEVV